MIKCALLRQQRLGTTPRVGPPVLLKFAAGACVKSVASEVYAHPWSASSSESRALLSDAEPDSDCPKGPLVFGREPVHLKPRSRAGLAGPRGPHRPERSCPSVRFQPEAARRPNAAPARTAPTQAAAGDTATQGRPLPATPTIVDLRLSAALAPQAAPWAPPGRAAPWIQQLRVLLWVLTLHEDDALSQLERNEPPM